MPPWHNSNYLAKTNDNIFYFSIFLVNLHHFVVSNHQRHNPLMQINMLSEYVNTIMVFKMHVKEMGVYDQ
ncbi:hypothetical protein, partial [Proteus columbae]|uniref:hypothetical protein n=1 Tax=Proteus columbae TaxID=1987580 RepID=UPI00200AA510